MLSVLKMDIDQCIHEYLRIAPRIFPVESLVSRSVIGKFAKTIFKKYRFDPIPFEMAVKSLVKQATNSENTMMRHGTSDGQQC